MEHGKNSFFNNPFIFPFHNFDNALKNAIKRTPAGNRIYFKNDGVDVKNTKSPVILFGCSFTSGAGLDDNETFSYKLSKYTGRNVYNGGLAGYGVRNMLYMLNDSDTFRNLYTDSAFPLPPSLQTQMIILIFIRCFINTVKIIS